MPEDGDRPSVAVAVIVQNGCVLLVHRRADDAAPPWVLPGGKLEPGEHSGEAAVREVLEETGLTIRSTRIVGERVHPDTGARIVYVACDVLAGTARVTDANEPDAVEWVPIAELEDYVPLGFFAPVQAHLDALLAAG